MVVGVYSDGSLTDETLLFTRTVASLAPASSTQLAEQVQGPLLCGLYVAAGPFYAQDETNRANNLAAVMPTGGICVQEHIYLPLVLRSM